MRNIRDPHPNLEKINAAQPKAVALDVILSDKSDDAEDARLEAALHDTRNLVLDCDLVGGTWEDPLPRFASAAAALGHVNLEIDRFDGVSREVSLEETANHQRRWAVALEAFRASRGQEIIESPDDVAVGGTVITAARAKAGRRVITTYLPPRIPTVSLDVGLRNLARQSGVPRLRRSRRGAGCSILR
jgi:CHASE2 domain-containing sensor protein